jgi:hypothetical protein
MTNDTSNNKGGHVCNWLGERFVTATVANENEHEDGFWELLGVAPPGTDQGTQRNDPARVTACGGYASIKGAGVTMTETGGITFGAPQIDSSTGYMVYPGTADSMVSGSTADPGAATTAPVVIDGRILLVSYNDPEDNFDDSTGESDYCGTCDPGFKFGKNPYRTTSGNVVFYDHVIPTQEFGCSDFAGEVAYRGTADNGTVTTDYGGETIVRSSIPSATTPALLPVSPVISSYSLSTESLKVDVRNGTTVKGASLAGSWIANKADFGTVGANQKPTELIGTPSVSQEPACNHPYLPARKNYSVTKKLSFTEVDVIPSN